MKWAVVAAREGKKGAPDRGCRTFVHTRPMRAITVAIGRVLHARQAHAFQTGPRALVRLRHQRPFGIPDGGNLEVPASCHRQRYEPGAVTAGWWRSLRRTSRAGPAGRRLRTRAAIRWAWRAHPPRLAPTNPSDRSPALACLRAARQPPARRVPDRRDG